MNKAEQKFALELERRRRLGQVVWWQFEPMRLKLADRTTYTPDFMAFDGCRVQVYEIKGYRRDDAMVKLKVAARLFPFFDFYLVDVRKDQWKHTRVAR